MKRIIFILLLFIPFCLTGQVVSSTVSYSQEAEPYGPEKISNGGFADATGWNVTGSWAIAGNVASFTTGTSGAVYQTDGDMVSSITTGETYKLEFDIASGGDVSIRFASSNNGIAYIDYTTYGNGHHSVEFGPLVDAGVAGFYVRSLSGTASYTIDNISVMKVN